MVSKSYDIGVPIAYDSVPIIFSWRSEHIFNGAPIICDGVQSSYVSVPVI